jgi:DNA-binding CsgD family transcriptional regulator
MRAPPSWYEFAERLRREQRTLQEISDLLGIAVPTIRTQLMMRMSDYDAFKQPTFSGEATARTRRIKQALAEGEHPPAIANREGVSRQWVYALRGRGAKRVDELVRREVDRTLLGDRLKEEGVIT